MDERATEALGHVQRALLEMIEAAKSTLGLVEDVVADPPSLAAVIAGIERIVATASTSPPPAPERPTQSGIERIPIR